jgi:thiol:disulfide interchange protein DsbD
MRFKFGSFLLVPFLSLSALAATYTQDTLPSLIKHAVVWQSLLSENQIRTNFDGVSEGSLLVEVQVETRNGFNLYRENLKFSSEWDVKVEKEPESFQFLDPVTKKIKDGYRGQSVFLVRATLPAGGVRALDKSFKLPLLVDFQACNSELCLLPATLRLDVPLTRSLESRLSSGAAEQKGFVEAWADSLKLYLEGDGFSLVTFLLLFSAGVITAFTPCVYPLYPITLGIFSRWSTKHAGRTLALSVSYCAGMTLSYALLGVVTASSGALFGSLTQNPIFLLAVGGVIAVSALAFSGLIPFQAPQFLQNIFMRPESPEAARLGAGRLALKAAGMGFGLGVVAAPCVGPVILALMAWLGTRFASGEASYAYGFLLLASFGAGMSLPFLVLAELTANAKQLPRLGRFTPYFKHLGTALMLAGSLYFIVPGLKLSGLLRQDAVQKKFVARALQDWDKSRWTVIDFRADWCAACLELEHETFTHASVSPIFEKSEWDFVSVDLTSNTPENKRIATEWNVVGLPTVLIAAPGGKVCRGLELFGFEDAEAFLARLKKAQEHCAQ